MKKTDGSWFDRFAHAGWTVLFAAVALALSGCGDRDPEVDQPGEEAAPELASFDPAVLANVPPGSDSATVREGYAHFLVCTVCHGPDGTGTPLGPSLRDGQWLHIAGEREEIARVIRSGVESPREHPVPMPEMGGGAFDEQELDALTAYVWALSRVPQ